MAKKLENIKAIKQMLDGTHKMQTRKSFGFADVSKAKENNTKREVGDRWTDSAGVVWEQCEGYRIKGADRADRLRDLRKYIDGPTTCPECNEKMSKRLDKKYFNMHKMCMDCVIMMETKMRLHGTYEEYERKKMLANAESWLADAEREKEYLKQEITKTEYINSDGSIEKWDLPYDPEEAKQRIEDGFVKFKEELLSKLGATNVTGTTTEENED